MQPIDDDLGIDRQRVKDAYWNGDIWESSISQCLRHAAKEIHCEKEKRGVGWELKERKIW
jgi:hypothetical protein